MFVHVLAMLSAAVERQWSPKASPAGKTKGLIRNPGLILNRIVRPCGSNKEHNVRMRTFAFPCEGGGHSSVCFPSFPFFLFSLFFPLFSFVFFFNPVKSFLCCMNSGTFEIQRLSSLYCAVHWSDQYTGR